jgi:MOSC domain-containing protein YiiM
MKLISLNIGKPQLKTWNGKEILTSIFKYPVNDMRKVSFTNIDGDEQSDLRVHGGINKAVYSYDLSHYEHWKTILPRHDWQHGMFGENLTTEGLPDDEVRIGNIYQIGTAKLQVVQPRFPCIKINIRFNLPDMIERFAEAKRSGIYFKVVEEGALQMNDEIKLVEESPFNVTVSEYVDCYYSKGNDADILSTILSIPYLPQRQRSSFESFQNN